MIKSIMILHPVVYEPPNSEVKRISACRDSATSNWRGDIVGFRWPAQSHVRVAHCQVPFEEIASQRSLA